MRTFQRTVVLPGLTPRQHVEVGLRWRCVCAGWPRALLQTPAYRAESRSRRGAAEALLGVFGLDRLADIEPAQLSAGRQRLLQVAAAAATGPDVLLLDEPSAGMRPDELALLENALVALAAAGLSMIVVEHNLAFLRRVAPRVIVLEEGKVLAEGSPAQVARNAAVREAYMGRRAGTLSGATRPTRRSPRARR